jgi:hypothetical protein
VTLPLALLPFEGMDDGDMADLATVLDRRGFACTVLPQMAMPAGVYDRPRDQYRVGRLLQATRQAVTGRGPLCRGP